MVYAALWSCAGLAGTCVGFGVGTGANGLVVVAELPPPPNGLAVVLAPLNVLPLFPNGLEELLPPELPFNALGEP